MSHCIILEASQAHEWAEVSTLRPLHPDNWQRIPADRRPTVLHPSRAVAEAEAKRLIADNPSGRFVIFEAVAVAHSIKVPTHITLGGQVMCERPMPILSTIDDVPF